MFNFWNWFKQYFKSDGKNNNNLNIFNCFYLCILFLQKFDIRIFNIGNVCEFEFIDRLYDEKFKNVKKTSVKFAVADLLQKISRKFSQIFHLFLSI